MTPRSSAPNPTSDALVRPSSVGKVLLIGAEENPALPILASLSRAGIAVHAASHRRLALGFFSRHARRRLVCPSPENETAWVECLIGYVRREGFDVVLAAGEDHTFLLARHRPLFAAYARVPIPDMPVFMLCRDKSLTMREAARLGVPTPRTYDPERVTPEIMAGESGFPLVVKPNVSDGARGIAFPRTLEELRRAISEVTTSYGACHVQEHVPHEGTQYKAEVLLGEDGRVLARCVYSKLRYYPPSGGSSTLNRTVDRPDILATAERMLRGIGWSGLGDCDFIEDPRDGTPKLMEINPRFTRSIKICVRAGVDFPLLLYRLAMGLPFEPTLTYHVGTMMRYLPADLMWFLTSPDRARARPGFFRTFREAPMEEIFSLDDPGPSLAYVLAMARDLVDPRGRRYRLRMSGGGTTAPRSG